MSIGRTIKLLWYGGLLAGFAGGVVLTTLIFLVPRLVAHWWGG